MNIEEQKDILSILVSKYKHIKKEVPKHIEGIALVVGYKELEAIDTVLKELDNRNGLLEDTKINGYLKGRKDESIAWKTKIEEIKNNLDKSIELQWCSTDYNETEVNKYQFAIETLEKLLNKE